MTRPESAEYFDWNGFVEFCEAEGISLADEEDYGPWWKCWKKAYSSAMNA